MENLQRNRKHEKNKYDENPEPKREYQKTNVRKILNQKENMEK